MEKIEIEIPDYIRTVELSKSRRQRYYEKGKKLPTAKKYLDDSKYEWQTFNRRVFLVDKQTMKKVVSNPKSAGTPRILTINGQKIYNGEVAKQMRNKVLLEIKKSFAPYLNKLDVISADSYPLKITLEIHDEIYAGSKSLWDADNRAWPYIKAFQDCLTGSIKEGSSRNKQIIPDDNILWITRPPATVFIPLEEGETRKLVFIIESEDDKRILNNKLHSDKLKEEIYEFKRISFWD